MRECIFDAAPKATEGERVAIKQVQDKVTQAPSVTLPPALLSAWHVVLPLRIAVKRRYYSSTAVRSPFSLKRRLLDGHLPTGRVKNSVNTKTKKHKDRASF